MRCHYLPRRGGSLTLAVRWRVTPPPAEEEVVRLASALSLPRPLAALLVQRSLTNIEEARAFLRPNLETLADPYALAGMAEAVTCLVAAVRSGKSILVHGDYDVDGQCATTVLTRALRAAGATVHPFVPHRLTDGYDFGVAGIAEAERVGASLVLTCDCGITAVEAVAEARRRGLQVVVTDHHLPGAVLPDANAVVDPQRVDDTSGLQHLCGTGIAFKMVQALVEPLGLPAGYPMHLLDYVAIATIADVVPLTGENRVLVKHGLRLLASSRWVGLNALREATRLTDSELRAGQVGYTMAPRLNAAGRMADAKLALRLLLTDDPDEATAVAQQLESLNQDRQALDQRILETALRMVEAEYLDPTAHPALVLSAEDWHPGVIGIVASRIVERYGRPTFMIATAGGVGKGSGRSVDTFDLHAALTSCGDLLDRFGGHRMAAGLTVRTERIPELRERFTAEAKRHLAPHELGPTQRVDLEVTLADITDDLERLARHLEPCGMGNAAPVFGIRGAALEASRVVGESHLKTTLVGAGKRLDGIAFGWANRIPWLSSGRSDVAFRLERNTWKGHSSLQARIVAFGKSGVA